MEEHVHATPEEIRELRETEAREAELEARGELPDRLDVESGSAWTLARTGIFAELPADDLAELTRHATRRSISTREETYLGDGARVWVVASGGVKLVHLTDEGRKLIEDVIDPGGFFGSLSPSPDQELFVQGLEDSVLLGVPQPVLWQVMGRNGGIALSVIQALDERQRRLSRRVTSLVFKSVEVRVVETILQMCKDYPEKCSHGVALDVRLSQQDLADLVGASRESVSRVISQMQKRDYVHRIGRVLCIPSLTRLKRLGRTYA